MRIGSTEFWRDIVRAYVQRFPIARGKGRVMEALAPLYASANEESGHLPGGATIRLDLREHVQQCIYFFGSYEVETVDWFRSALRPGATVLDIGAHVGQYTLIAASYVGSTGRVHSFEPNPVTFQRLVANISLNGFDHVYAHPTALSDVAGDATLYMPQHGNLGEASLQECVIGSETTRIRSISADHWMESADLGNPPRIDLIKLDVQGFELRVIQGAEKLLARFHPVVLCEFEERWLQLAGTSSVELKRVFRGFGYTVNRIEKGGLAPVDPDEVHSFENLVLTPDSRSAMNQ